MKATYYDPAGRATELSEAQVMALYPVAYPLMGVLRLTADERQVAVHLGTPHLDTLAQGAHYVVFGVANARDARLPLNPVATARVRALVAPLALPALAGPVLVVAHEPEKPARGNDLFGQTPA